jgi:hypothetical protein
MIVRSGRKWLLVTSQGVYEHGSKTAAETQEKAIRIAKARRAGHVIPPAPNRLGGSRRKAARSARSRESRPRRADRARARW